jgi:hypothetical protein
MKKKSKPRIAGIDYIPLEEKKKLPRGKAVKGLKNLLKKLNKEK